MSIKLLHRFSDASFRYKSVVLIEDPFEPSVRALTKHIIDRTIDAIDPQDHKIIEHTSHFEMLFRRRYDKLHFDQFSTANMDGPILCTFSLPRERKTSDREALAAGWLAVAARKAETDMEILFQPKQNCIAVRFPSINDYLKCWRNLPKRQRIAMAQKEPSSNSLHL